MTTARSWRPAVGEGVEFPRTTVGDVLRRAAGEAPDRLALVDGRPGQTGRWTYGDLLASAERIAQVLLDDHRPGDRIALFAGNCAEWILVELGIALAGLVLVPVNPAYRPGEMAHATRVAAPALLVHGDGHRSNDLPVIARLIADETGTPVISLRDLVERSPARTGSLPVVEPEWPAQIQFTSGTTGPPKGAELSHLGLVGMPSMAVPMMDLGEHPVWLNFMPLFHIGGCGLSTIGPLVAVGTQVLLDRFDAGRVLELIASEQVTVMGSVPTMLLSILDHPERGHARLDSLEVVISGGAPVSTTLIQTIERELDARFIVAFGQTESHGHISQTRPNDEVIDKSETVGRPLPHVEIKLVDPGDGQVVPLGTVGELCTRSPLVMRGYLGQADATAAAIDPDGFLHTGDLATLDERGYLRVAGRARDVICRGGENVSPSDVEAAIAEHPDIAEVVVVGLPDDRLGQSVAACVRFQPGQAVSGDVLERWLADRIAPYKIPRRWAVVEQLPLTSTGKVQRYKLPALFDGDRASDLHSTLKAL